MFRILETERTLARRLMSAATLLAFLVASTGYPVWSAVAQKDLTQPFPCMHRKCGCRNAEQCWRGCCCFTNQQKLAWAKRHGVTAPKYVEFAAAEEKSPKKVAACCSAGGGNVQGCEAKNAASKKPAKQLGAVFEPLSCQGYAEQWVAVGAIHVALPEVWQIDLPCTGTVLLISEARDSTVIAPPSPPPWC
jgi:hypothetical protein